MTLDEAIKYEEEIAREQEEHVKGKSLEKECLECAAEHRQLADWLKDYKRLLEQEAEVEKATAWFKEALESGYYKDSMRNPATEEEAKSSEIKECQPPTDDWEKYADRLYDLAYQHGKKDAMEPCKDAISRSDVLDLCDSEYDDYRVRHFKEDVECLPSIRPARPRGKWCECEEEKGFYRCTICKNICDWKYKYCPNCGAAMGENEDGNAE